MADHEHDHDGESQEQEGQSRLSVVNFAGFLGWKDDGGPEEDDPAETYHEAAKMSAGLPPTIGAQMLETDRLVQESIARSVKRHPQLPSVALPEPAYPDAPFGSVIHQRRSRRDFTTSPLSLQDLSTLLHAGYGVSDDLDLPGGHRLRTAPSGGALYPLEVFPVVRRVEGLASGLYHYDALEHELEVIREVDVAEPLRKLLIKPDDFPSGAETCAVIFFMVGVFWRTRFKYAMRGYRFVLLEAGHVGQNLLLAAEAMGLNAYANGGFWDRRVDDFIGVDGVNESVVYSALVGPRPAERDGGSA